MTGQMEFLDRSQTYNLLRQEEHELAGRIKAQQSMAAEIHPQASLKLLSQRLLVVQRLRQALEEAVYAREVSQSKDRDVMRRLAELLVQLMQLAGADGLAELLKEAEAILVQFQQTAPNLPHPLAPVPELARVIHVADGDSFSIEGGWRVRCIGIDTPELHGDDARPEPFALVARSALRAMIEGKMVRLEADHRDMDRYGRLLRYVYAGDTFVNAEMLRTGYAVVLTVSPNIKFEGEFEQIEAIARMRKQGVWG